MASVLAALRGILFACSHWITNLRSLLTTFRGKNRKIFWEAVVQRSAIATVTSTHKKQQRICIEYTYIGELMLWLHRAKFEFVNIK